MSARRDRVARTARRARWLVPVLAVATTVVALGSPSAGAATTRDSGLMCTGAPEGAASTTKTFTLTAHDGHISMPDGNSVYMWGLGAGSDTFQYPGPVLCVNSGDRVNVVLRNALPDAVSLVFPGQESVTANQAPVGPVFDALGALSSLAQPAAAAAAGLGSMTYSFIAGAAGSYLYQSGTDQAKQVEMGLFGTLVVRPAGHPNQAYPEAYTVFSDEFLMVMTELDPAVHHAVEIGQPFDLTSYHARYFMINGRSFPDTIAPNNAAWLPQQPYGAMVHMQPKTAANPAPYLFRYVNVSPVPHPFHPHGNHGDVIARDGRLLADASGALDVSKFTVTVGPGQTADGLYDWTDVEQFDAVANPVDKLVPLNSQQDLLYANAITYYSGSPYLGLKNSLPIGTTSYNQCGEYYHVLHSHALDEVTTYGAVMGGMLTLERIDPPGGCP